MQAAGFKTWTELFANKNAPLENPERPTMAAWMPTSRISDPVFTLKRNPYYIGVDTAGNQLPYIDEVRFTYFADAQALNLAAIAGNFDMQDRHINMTNYPVLKEQEKTGKYHIITWPTFGGADAVIIFNQTYTADPEMGKLMATKDFRIALSLRDQSRTDQGDRSSWAWARRARPCRRRGIRTFPGDECAQKYTEFKRDEANKMLDGIGLTKKDAEGIRLLPNGKPATIEICVVPAFGAWPDVAQLVAKDWEAVGIKTIVQIRERALHFKMRDAQRADDRNLERRHQRLPVHRRRQGRSAQRADPDAGPAVRAVVRDRRQGRRGADARDQEDRRADRQGAHRRARRADQGCAGALHASGPTRSTRSAPSA